MDWNLALICLLTGVINLIGALAYAARIAGVSTRRIAMSFALFNMLVLVSRLSNGLLAPLVAKRVEHAIAGGGPAHLLADFRWLMGSASLAVVIGIALVPMAQRVFSAAIGTMRSTPSSVSFCTVSSGLSPLVSAKPIVMTGAGAATRSTSPSARSAPPVTTHSRQAPAPSDAVRRSPSRRRSTRNRWWASASLRTGAAMSSTKTWAANAGRRDG